MSTKNTNKKETQKPHLNTKNRRQFYPVSILRNGILYVDGHVTYTDARGNWLYVSEDGMQVYMYNNVANMIKDLYKRSDDEDYVIAGWDMYPTRFEFLIDSGYEYYNARFEN
jgi:prepilin-type processing-associated H-X9-DG protein